MIEVTAGGLETCVQDFPGRVGFRRLGIPRSGPLDSSSFRMANVLVGNSPAAAGLEIQFSGPALRILRPVMIAICGADNQPKLNGRPIAVGESHFCRYDDVLTFGFARAGARTYLAVSGGIDVPPMFGSRSTFLQGSFGGFEGRALRRGDILLCGSPPVSPGEHGRRALREHAAAELSNEWEIEVIAGSHAHWLTPGGRKTILGAEWKVSSRSNRIGYRLEGPPMDFSEHSLKKPAACGGHPSNKLDSSCAEGSMLICGEVPTVLLADGPSLTGYMVPFVVPRAGLGKLGQARPGDSVHFRQVVRDEALRLARKEEEIFEDPERLLFRSS